MADESWKWTHSAAQVFFSCVLSIVAIVEARVSYVQWDAMREQAELSRQAVEITKAQAMAYVTATQCEIIERNDGNPRFYLSVINAGPTGAKFVRFHWEFGIVRNDQDRRAKGTKSYYDDSPGYLTYEPQGAFYYYQDTDFTASDMSALRSGRKKVWADVTISFVDTFDGPHKKTFSFFICNNPIATSGPIILCPDKGDEREPSRQEPTLAPPRPPAPPAPATRK
jgi:hypothetical protein